MQYWLMAAIVMVSFAAEAAMLQPKNEWKQCAKDADCVSIQGVCRLATVNVVYRAEAERYYAQEAKETVCPQEFWHPPDPVPRCRLNMCEMVQKD